MAVRSPQFDLPHGVVATSAVWDDDSLAGELIAADFFAIPAAGSVSVTLSQTDAPDTLAASAAAQVTAEASLRDDDDTLTAAAVVHAAEAPQIIVGASIRDADDSLAAVSVVRWPVRGLLRTSPPLIRTRAAAGM